MDQQYYGPRGQNQARHSGRHRQVPQGPAARLMALWWGYLPLVLACLVGIAMVVVIPSQRPDAEEVAPGTDASLPDGQTASGWGDTVLPCEDRERQVEGDGYSPPCYEYAPAAGDNGGATAKGVTEDTVTLSYRMTSDPHIMAVLAQVGGVPFEGTNEQMASTAQALVEYFNENFEFYGRELKLEEYNGRGAVLTELTGGGQEDATNDAVTVANQVQAFADVTGWSQPFADALARNGVISIGAPYMSREWFVAHRPYAWSNYPDCTIASEAATEYFGRRLNDKPATWAGGDLANRTRTFGLIVPNNSEYRQCADAGDEVLASMGARIDLRQEYLLDTAQLQTQAASLLAKLKAEDITSVIMAADPILTVYMAEQAQQQDYQPEWLLLGTGFTDLDLVGQAIAAQSGEEWGHAFGTSPSASPEEWGTSDAYAAFKSVRPDEEPSTLVDLIYNQLYLVALGIQMAGPELTPETFEQGMFAYPGGEGAYGRWDFDPTHYTGITDVREIWWDPDTPSPFNGEPGTYRDNGERYERGDIPEGDPEVFRD